MILDLLAEADAAAALAAEAAGVVIRELDTLAELDAVIALFDEVWVPEDGNPSVRLDMLRAMTKAGNYASAAYDLATGEMLGACVGFFGPPAHAAQPHRRGAGGRAWPVGRVRAQGAPAGLVPAPRRAGNRLDLRPADQAERVL